MDNTCLLSCNFLALLLVTFFSLPPLLINGATIASCAQTPYPKLCDHYMSTTTNTLVPSPTHDFHFRDASLRVTMDQAAEAHRLVSSVDVALFSEPLAKLAWQDCVELYDHAVHQLNHSVSSSNHLDVQTWLSAAMTDHQTCQNGFVDFSLSSHLQYLPNMLSNFSKLLSNSLAVNKPTVEASRSTSTSAKYNHGRRLLSHGFPAWLSSTDRRLLQAAGQLKADIVVAGDGSGDYKTIGEAVEVAAKTSGGKRIVIHVKAGVYKENVEIDKSMTNMMFVGDGMDATVVTGNRNVQDGSTTYRSATFGVSGNGFMARDMTFENTAGPEKHQAVALRVGSDKSVFYRCSFKGYQDTLYVFSQRQFYRDCDVYGTVDFICGDATAVLQGCNVYVRKPMSGQRNFVTAQSRTDPNENTGIVLHGSRVTAASDLRSVQGSYPTYLGRPWKEYSRTVVMKSSLDSLIDPAGWFMWIGGFALDTLYYREYMNTGAGAATGGRVKWKGYQVMTSAEEAEKFTVESFLDGGSWIPATGVPYQGGL